MKENLIKLLNSNKNVRLSKDLCSVFSEYCNNTGTSCDDCPFTDGHNLRKLIRELEGS